MSTLLSDASILMCVHGGQATITPTGGPLEPNEEYRISGRQVALMSDPVVIAGCPFMANGVSMPCIGARWVVGNNRFLVKGVPTLDIRSSALTMGVGPPTPLIIVAP